MRLPTLTSSGDGGVYAEAEDYIFPNMPGGIEETILHSYYLSQGMEEDGYYDLIRRIRPMKQVGNKFRIMTEEEFYNQN
jgi:hypothetical protein